MKRIKTKNNRGVSSSKRRFRTGSIGSVFVAVGVIAFIIGLFLFFAGVKSHGSMDTQYGRFSGPVWFIFLAFGLVLILLGVVSPI